MNPKTTLTDGQVVYVNLPTNTGTTEQEGARYCVILKVVSQELLILVPLTSKLQHAKKPYTLFIPPTEKNGLQMDSIALAVQIRATGRPRIKNVCGELV